MAGPISLITINQARNLPSSAEPLLLTNYAKTKIVDENTYKVYSRHVWLALDAIKYFSNKSDISTGGMEYCFDDRYTKGYSIFLHKQNYIIVTKLGGVRPCIIVKK